MSSRQISKNNESVDWERLRRELRESDFDGHTEFHNLTFTQKLTWLSEAVVSTYLIAKQNPQAGCALFF
jgi:hypothetical protein